MRILLFLSISILLGACTSDTAKQEAAAPPDAAQLQEEIQALQKKLETAPPNAFDTTSALALVDKTEQLHAHHPEEEGLPDLLFRAADVARSAGDFERAITLWGLVNRDYEDYERAPDALFLQGFVADQDLRDEERALRFYRYFLQRHPDHELARDARLLQGYLESGQSPEELIRLFEQQANEVD